MERKYVKWDEINAVRCAASEQETTICITRESNVMEIFSSDNTFITKIRKVMERGAKTDTWRCWEGSRDAEGNLTGYFFETSKKNITLRSGVKAERKVHRAPGDSLKRWRESQKKDR